MGHTDFQLSLTITTILGRGCLIICSASVQIGLSKQIMFELACKYNQWANFAWLRKADQKTLKFGEGEFLCIILYFRLIVPYGSLLRCILIVCLTSLPHKCMSPTPSLLHRLLLLFSYQIPMFCSFHRRHSTLISFYCRGVSTDIILFAKPRTGTDDKALTLTFQANENAEKYNFLSTTMAKTAF